jgi:two-component system response regulator NreC
MYKHKNKIKILIADDHTILRSGLKLMLENEKNLKLIGEAATGEETIKKTLKLKPDILILDISFPDINGLEIAKKILSKFTELKILILTMYEAEEYLKEFLKIGVRGFVIKKAADSELINAINAIYNGNVYIHSSMAKVLKESEKKILSKRELQVLINLAQGKTNKEIANTLNISIKSVETYRKRICVKLKLDNRAALTEYAIKKGLIL